MERLRAAGLPLALVTNTTSRTRAAVAGRLAGEGFPVGVDDILTAPAVTAAYLREHHPDARCLLINTGDVREDLAGVELVEEGADDEGRGAPDVVVFGGAGDEFSYRGPQCRLPPSPARCPAGRHAPQSLLAYGGRARPRHRRLSPGAGTGRPGRGGGHRQTGRGVLRHRPGAPRRPAVGNADGGRRHRVRRTGGPALSGSPGCSSGPANICRRHTGRPTAHRTTYSTPSPTCPACSICRDGCGGAEARCGTGTA